MEKTRPGPQGAKAKARTGLQGKERATPDPRGQERKARLQKGRRGEGSSFLFSLCFFIFRFVTFFRFFCFLRSNYS